MVDRSQIKFELSGDSMVYEEYILSNDAKVIYAGMIFDAAPRSGFCAEIR